MNDTRAFKLFIHGRVVVITPLMRKFPTRSLYWAELPDHMPMLLEKVGIIRWEYPPMLHKDVINQNVYGIEHYEASVDD